MKKIVMNTESIISLGQNSRIIYLRSVIANSTTYVISVFALKDIEINPSLV